MQSIEISSSQKGIITEISLSKISDLTINGRVVSFRIKEIDEHKQMELCYSIQRNGLLNPIIVRSLDNDQFELISGKRRIDAFKTLGLRKILAHVVDINDRQAFEMKLIEDIHSDKISPIEEGIAYKNYVKEYGWGGITELAKNLSKSVSYVDRRIKLLELPEDLLQSVNQGKLKPSIADELLCIKNPDQKSEIIDLVRERSPSLRELRRAVKKTHANIEEEVVQNTKMVDIDEKTQRSFDQAIIAIRFSMSKLTSIITNNEENWIVYETLMQHKRVLHEQIDILIKEKRKLRL
jgi:ParB family chromosome partitioning protein